ncbi:uncharacterized protein si:ch73-109i22.2 [Trichomycterus rosablanca]|uniref:uncharacterized protein si:ch73-109i22.2 n=1 Tax=Trichomycterus rosablanca TaxID=2290929 RepID=UPI002F35D018
MDFDYQKIKDEESCQREERLGPYLIQQPRPTPRTSTAPNTPPSSRKPPIKPRRSIKNRSVTPSEKVQDSQDNQTRTEEVKRIAPSQVLSPAGPLDAQTPSLQAHNLLWFQRTQLPRLPKPVPCWLHGFASRREAEQLLQDKPQGCFLLRLSESKVGFVLSYRGADKCRHFIIEEETDVPGTEGRYLIVGEKSRHWSLEDLLKYYTQNPVGPFNEILTVPCMQANGSCEDRTKLEVTVERGDESKEKIASIPPSIIEDDATESTDQVAHTGPESAQYAVVKKPLRKTKSLIECMSIPKMEPPLEEDTDNRSKFENGTEEPAVSNADLRVGGDVAHPVDAPYARVNKPPRAATASSISDMNDVSSIPDVNGSVLGASAAADSQWSSSAAAEQKYWQLEPMHTYEETLHTCTRDNRNDFHAMGRQNETAEDSGSMFNHHLYSEVNIRGTRDDFIPMSISPPVRAGAWNSNTSSTRPIPRLPQRPPPRLASAARLDVGAQSFGGSPMTTLPQNISLNQTEQLLSDNSASAIYEQIPERRIKSRPPLPLPNAKH